MRPAWRCWRPTIWNRLLLGLAAGDGALRGHAPLLGLPAPRLLGEGTSLAEVLAFLPLPVRSFTLRAGTLAEALGMLAGFRDRCFVETTGLVLLRDPALEQLDGLLPGQIQEIKPALAAAGAAGLVLWLRDLATEPFGAVLARVADAPRRRHATVWNALPFARRFDGSTGITAAEPPQEAAESYQGIVTALPHADTGRQAWRQLAEVAGGRRIPQRDYCIRLRGATVIGEALVLDSRGNLVVLPYHFDIRDCDQVEASPALEPLTAPGRALGNRPGLAITQAGEAVVAFEAVAAEPRFVAEPAFYWLPQFHDYTHLMSELLPSLEFLFRHAEREGIATADLRLVVPQAMPGHVGEFLALLGFTEGNFIRCVPGRPLIFAELPVPGLPAHFAAGRTRRFDDFWARLATRLDAGLEPSPARPARKLFVSRRDETRYRNLLNEEALFAIAAGYGYEFLMAATLSMAEKVAAFRDASHVVGPVGPGLFHAVFGFGGALGVLSPDTYDHLPAYLHHMAAARRFRVTYLFGTGIASPNARFPGHGDIHGDFVIAPERFTALLDALEQPR